MSESSSVPERVRAAVVDPPRGCDDLPGIGGVIRARPEDFAVEELPAYPADGGAGHLLVWLRKRSLTTEEAVREVARQLRIPQGEIGVAGLKDRDAVTRQQISVPDRAAAALAQFRHPAIELSDVRPHSHKLRRGHLRGNRFIIVVRELELELEVAQQRAQAKLARLTEHGRGPETGLGGESDVGGRGPETGLGGESDVGGRGPETGLRNYYGSQRFGEGARNLEPGLASLAGRRRRPKGDISVSAGQSALFNFYLATRAERGLLTTVLVGDILQKRDSGGMFECEDARVEQARLDAGELVLTGPMYGSKMRAPKSGTDAAALEAEVLAAVGLTSGKLAKLGRNVPGTRRQLAIWPADASASLVDGALQLQFCLPAGSYATVLLREVSAGAQASVSLTNMVAPRPARESGDP